MLKIQVMGKGMIPRGYGLAPRKEPFPADLNLIQVILSTPGLSVNMINPETNKPVPITNQNLLRMWDKYSDVRATAKVVQTTPSVPVVENSKNTNSQPATPEIKHGTVITTSASKEPKTDIKTEEPKKEISQDPEKKEPFSIKPVNADDKKDEKKDNKNNK